MSEEKCKYLNRRLSELQNVRLPREKIWDKASFYCGFDSRLFRTTNNQMPVNIFDSTARHALNQFNAAFKSILVPTSQKWHKLRPTEPVFSENENVRRYMEHVNNLLFSFRYSSNSRFPFEVDLMFEQLAVYGHSAFFVTDDIGKGILYRTIPCEEIFIDRNYQGKVDVVYRVYELSARNAVKEFKENATAKMKERADRKPDEKIKILHAVEPREDRDPVRKDYKGMAYASYHVNLTDKELIYESGYRTMPYQVPVYQPSMGTPYGDGPALQAFYDMISSNEISKAILRISQLQGSPSLLAGNKVKNAERAGKTNAVIYGGLDEQGRPLVQTMQYGGNFAVTAEMQVLIRQTIEKFFLVPLFQTVIQDKTMTATEVEERKIEKATLLAPMCERLSAEWLTPMITRELDIIQQYGYLDDVPDEMMAEGSIEVAFESPAVHLQRSSEIRGLYKTLETAMTVSQIDPGVLDLFDTDAFVREVSYYEGAPSKVMRPPDQVAKIRESKATQQEAQALLQAAPVLASTVKDLNQGGAHVPI